MDDKNVFPNVIPTLIPEDFESRLNYDQYEETIAHLEAFPGDCVLAKLANLAYHDEITIPQGLEDWQVLTYASDNSLKNEYRGVAYFNSKMCHVVIAHRGTDTLSSYYNDGCLGFKVFNFPQAQSAASFAYFVAEKVKMINTSKNNDDKPPFRLTITGHSLGAWLAQYTTFIIKYLTLNEEGSHFIRDDNYLSNIHPHTVVFESPGCKASFEQLVQKLIGRYAYRKYGNYNTLDMTVYLNEPSWINSTKRQIGTIYMLPIKSHKMDKMVEYLESNEVVKQVVLDMTAGWETVMNRTWNKILGTPIKPKLEKAKDDRCSLNVFNELELDFIKDWNRIKNDIANDSINVKNFQDKYGIPQFKLNLEYNLLKGKKELHGEDVKKIILIVKNLRLHEEVVYEMIKDNVGDKIYEHLFQQEVELFVTKFRDFNGYYFKDIYGLEKFFKSYKKILHVSVVRPDNLPTDSMGESSESFVNYGLETNIINNVITYYRENGLKPGFDLSKEKLAFLDWHTLSKFVQNSSNFLNNYSLLVVESYFEDEIQNERILEFLQNIKIKAIVLSINRINFIDPVNIMEVNGFGKMPVFGNLTPDSQELLRNKRCFQSNNQANNEPVSLRNLILNVTNENLTNSFPMVSVLKLILFDKKSNSIVIDSHYSNLLKSVLFYDLYRELDPQQLLHNLDNSKVFILHEDDTEVDLGEISTNITDLVKIKSSQEYEKQCFENIAQTKYLITTKRGKIYLTSIFNYDFYIHRSIIHKRNVKPNIFKNTTDLLDYYIFYGNKIKYDSLVCQQEDRFKFVFTIDEAKSTAQLLEREKLSAHVFRIYPDGAIIWKMSYGSITFLQKHMQSKEVTIGEQRMMNDERIIIISGEPGIGKSSVIEYFYLNLKKRYWIFPIQLRNCSFDGVSDELTFHEVAQFLIKNCSYDPKSIQHIIVSLALQYGSYRPIYILMDSFDEICNEEYKIKVISIINFLKHNSNVKIIITTRPHLTKQLENGICVFSSHFKPLNYEIDIVTFLVNFWKSHLGILQRQINEDHLKTVATDMRGSAQNSIGASVDTFIEIPINIRLLAETVNPIAFTTLQFCDVLTLYNKYIKKRCNIYFKRFSLDPHPTVKKWLVETILGKFSALSISQALNIDIQHINDEEMEEFYKVGLVYLDNNSLNYKFLHDSVCDYFISDSIKQWLSSQMYILFVEYDVGKFLISELFLNEELKKVRLFLNFHLKRTEITPNRIKLCKEKFMQIGEDEYSLLFNNAKESIFHICIRENLIYLLKYFLLKFLDATNAKKFLTDINTELKTPLYYAIINTSKADNPSLAENSLKILLQFLSNIDPITNVREILLPTLFNHFDSQEELEKLNKYLENFASLKTIMSEFNEKIPLVPKYLNACKANDLEALTQILSEFGNDEMMKTYLLQSTNKNKENGIHLTSDIKIAEILIKPFNINLKDLYGITPLCHSIIEQRGDIARMLIEKGASYVGDDFGLTPFIRAAKHNLKEIMEIILNSDSKIFIDECSIYKITPLMYAARSGNEEIVDYLIEKGADINLRDFNGLTALQHAAKGIEEKHIRIVKILKDKGSDINTQDKHGTTPLFYNVKHNNFSMINGLLSHGADVNIRNSYGQYPLQRLIKVNLNLPANKVNKKVDACIAKFLSGEFPPPAEREMLSEKETSYIQKFL